MAQTLKSTPEVAQTKRMRRKQGYRNFKRETLMYRCHLGFQVQCECAAITSASRRQAGM